MLEIYSKNEIEKRITGPRIGYGNKADVFDIGNREVYKKYYKSMLVNETFYNGVSNIKHFENLASIDAKRFIFLSGICLCGDEIDGILMKKIDGKELKKQKKSIYDFLQFDDEIREDMKEISRIVNVFDLNAGSFIFTPQNELYIIDTDSFLEEDDLSVTSVFFDYYFSLLTSLNYSYSCVNYLYDLRMLNNIDDFCLKNLIQLMEENGEIIRDAYGKTKKLVF